ncbi:MAG: phosphoribosylamine--glycine ligase [Candidatus Limnocylindrales bacterium]
MTPRRILVVGSGAREHALAWRLRLDPGVETIVVAPGNPGMTDVAEVRPGLEATDPAAVVALAGAERVDLVVIGPEAPLVAGVADALRQVGIPAFGPDAAAARIEGSKAFCREVARAAGVPMAEGADFIDSATAIAYAARVGAPLVVKADGLAAGKGVTICSTLAEAEAAIRAALDDGAFGSSGERIVVEQALTGPEVSLVAICDGRMALAMSPARDHKRIGEGDSGPNTGGMGAVAPRPEIDRASAEALIASIHRPVLGELARRGAPFRGALYAGLMLTAKGPRLLEFNARFGDPETQVMVPLVAGPLAPLLLAAAEGRLAEAAREQGIEGTSLPAQPGAAVGVVLAAPGYPGTPRTGTRIEGLAELARVAPDVRVFFGGVAEGPGGGLVTAGGRVLTVVGQGRDVAAAATAAQEAADLISFPGIQRRRDIGRHLAVAQVAR